MTFLKNVGKIFLGIIAYFAIPLAIIVVSIILLIIVIPQSIAGKKWQRDNTIPLET